MPFGALDRQPIGISLLKAALERNGTPCLNRHFMFDFAEFVGAEDYRWIAQELPYVAFAGDWCFTRALYGSPPGGEDAYFSTILKARWHLADDEIGRIRNICNLVEPFLAHCLTAEDWREYALIGFTSTFEQNIASLALAKRLKSLFPEIPIVFGGANWEGVMGQELHRQFPFVDFAFSGEADESFPRLAKLVLERNTTSGRLAKIPGIVYRGEGKTVATASPSKFTHMDDLPVPDYEDYFRELDGSTVSASVVPGLLLETSRGCWWGAKSHCTFCGLNGGSIAFRSKSAARILEELDYLVDRWRIEQIEVVDNILDMGYFSDLLPELANRDDNLRFFYETKANLKKDQVKLLAKSGVTRIQPGIESMSDHVLQLMRKGTNALRNIQLLKWCREFKVAVDWNILYGFPGETQQDYEQIMALLPAIRFLDPPTACGPIRLDRFSPYFVSPAAYGLVNVRPMASFAFLYPFSQETLNNIAYYFDFEYAKSVEPGNFATRTIEFAAQWKQQPDRGSLDLVESGESHLTLVDTRNNEYRTFVLSGMEKAAYYFCDDMRTPSKIREHLQEHFDAASVTKEQVVGFLDSLVANQLMVTDGKHYLSLAIMRPSIKKPRPTETSARLVVQ